jgi:hypothetical protein
MLELALRVGSETLVAVTVIFWGPDMNVGDE